MTSRLLIPLVLLLINGPWAEAKEATSSSETLTLGTNQLQRIGTGELRKWFIKGCDITLYAPPELSRAEMLSNTPRCLELHYTYPITAKQFANGAWHSLEQTYTKQELLSLRPRIEALHALYRDVRRKDRYRIYYLPGEGTSLELNGRLLGTIPGADFASAYFSVWLGTHPLSDKLRDRLLAGAAQPEEGN